MYSGDAVYLRTESGREEIHNKSHGLTQSERLVLILVDGVTSVSGLKIKLKGLTEERFDRALTTLIDRQFMTEILLRFDGAMPEEIAEDIAEKFLHQDDLDPVTVISYDPEEEFGASPLAPPPSPRSVPAPRIDLKQWVNQEDALQEDVAGLVTGSPIPAPKAGSMTKERQPDLLLEETRFAHPALGEEGASSPAPFPITQCDRSGAQDLSPRSVLFPASSTGRQWAWAIGLGVLLLLYLRFR